MEIYTKNKKLKKAMADHREAVRRYGQEMAELIERRIAQLDTIANLAELWPPNSGPERCHELTGTRKETFSMNVKQPYRLIFKPISDQSKPNYKDDKTWWASIDSVEILDVEDTHE